MLTNLKGKQLATPYAKAVMKMLPKTHYNEGEENIPHEPINEIHVHNLTLQQLFTPVSESRHFTREDAAKAFHVLWSTPRAAERTEPWGSSTTPLSAAISAGGAVGDGTALARALVNRLWGHLLGRGLVDPVDDMRATNPPSNPELLDALAKEVRR